LVICTKYLPDMGIAPFVRVFYYTIDSIEI
jgi:hypothetical protein